MNNETKLPPDRWLFLVTLILLSFGVAMVFNASYPLAIEVHDDPYYYLRKQALWAGIGLIGMFAASRISYWKLTHLAVPALFVSIGLLVAVLIAGHGAQGAQRWIGYGPIKIQPSEFAKLALVLYLAKVIAARPKIMTNLWGGVMPLLLVTLIPILLTERQPDLGTAITMVLTLLFVLFTGGAKARWVITLVAIFAIAGVGLAAHKGLDSYRWKRMITFVNPDVDSLGAGYQIRHSKIALGTGGVTGLGFGESREKRLGGLPAQRTDFIFAIVGEEFGLLGTCGVLILFLLLTARGLQIAYQTKNPFGTLLATGITSMISVQALVNIAVVTASIPATGVPLPFLSYGGSSLVPTLLGIGILLNISMNPHYKEAPPKRRRLRVRDGDTTTTVRAVLPRLPASDGSFTREPIHR